MNYNMSGCIYHANGSYICMNQTKKTIIENMSNQNKPSDENIIDTDITDNDIYMSELNTFNIDHAKWMENKNTYMKELQNYSITRHCTNDTGNESCTILDNNLVNYSNGSECCISRDESGKCTHLGHTPICVWSDNYINNRITQWEQFPSNLEPTKPIDPRL
uniref:Uncharacterized protein n=1 Tax=viral metagenome TaxID=1070528 RepID=A0A6C0H863_9ZZZZ